MGKLYRRTFCVIYFNRSVFHHDETHKEIIFLLVGIYRHQKEEEDVNRDETSNYRVKFL